MHRLDVINGEGAVPDTLALRLQPALEIFWRADQVISDI
jgi:hypothetical protein